MLQNYIFMVIETLSREKYKNRLECSGIEGEPELDIRRCNISSSSRLTAFRSVAHA